MNVEVPPVAQGDECPESDHFRELLADAWDEGAKHRNDALGFEDNGSCFRHCNPYRKAENR